MPRRTTNSTPFGAIMSNEAFRSVKPGTKVVYLSLMAIARRPYVDSAAFLINGLARLSGLAAVQVVEALTKLEAVDLFVPSRAQPFSESFYLPYAIQHDTVVSSHNAMHRRHIQKRLALVEKHAPDIVERFARDYPEWMRSTELADTNSARLRDFPTAHHLKRIRKRHHDLESPAGTGAQAD